MVDTEEIFDELVKEVDSSIPEAPSLLVEKSKSVNMDANDKNYDDRNSKNMSVI